MQDSDALARIAAAVTPAVMVSACGLLALGLDNQAARMTGRLRDLAREYRGNTDERRARHLQSETRVLSRRHALYTAALLANYSALLSFLLASATALAFGATAHGLVLVIFGLGVLLLSTMAICTLLSVRLSRRSIMVEERNILSDRDAPPSIRLP
jgi:CHASE3 domain sensor protein